MPKPISYKFRLLYLCVFVLIFLIGFPVLVFYSTGYTIDDAFGLSVRGGIYVFMPEPNTSVFIENELKATSGFFNKEAFIDHLKPDKYLVLVTNDDFWPWAKFVDVQSYEVEALTPFLVPKVIEAEEIPATSEDYKDTVALFAAKPVSKVTGAQTPNTLKAQSTSTSEVITRRKVKIWLDDDSIFAQWLGENDAAPEYYCHPAVVGPVTLSKKPAMVCTDPLLVFHSAVPIRRIDFYPYRDDAIMLALDNGVYAVETDNRMYQNFYPVYRGQQPDFRINKNQVYIKDTDYYALLNLDN